MKQKKRLKEFQSSINKNNNIRSRSLGSLINSNANSNINSNERCNRTYDAIYPQRSISIGRENSLYSSYNQSNNYIKDNNPQRSRQNVHFNSNSIKSNNLQRSVSTGSSYIQSSNSIKVNNPQSSFKGSTNYVSTKMKTSTTKKDMKSSLTEIKDICSSSSISSEQIIESIICIGNAIQSRTKGNKSDTRSQFSHGVHNTHQSYIDQTPDNQNFYERKVDSCHKQDMNQNIDKHYEEDFSIVNQEDNKNQNQQGGNYCQKYNNDEYTSDESDDYNVPNIIIRPTARKYNKRSFSNLNNNKGKIEQSLLAIKKKEELDNYEDSTSDEDLDKVIATKIINGANIMDYRNEVIACKDFKDRKIVGNCISESSMSFQSNDGSYDSIDRYG